MSLNKSQLLDLIHHSRTELEQTVNGLTEAQLAAPGPEGGWSVKDHLVHLMAWENSMVYLLNRRARHLGLGVDEATYLGGDDDVINAAIQAKHADRPPAEILADWRATHQQLLETLNRLTDAELQKPYAHFLPDEPGDDGGQSILNRIGGNTYEHYDEHRGYIQSLIASLP